MSDRFRSKVLDSGMEHAVELIARTIEETLEKGRLMFPSDDAFRAGVVAILQRCAYTANVIEERDAWQQKAQASLHLGIGVAARERQEADARLVAIGVDPNLVPEDT